MAPLYLQPLLRMASRKRSVFQGGWRNEVLENKTIFERFVDSTKVLRKRNSLFG